MRTETALFWLVAILATVVAAHLVAHAADDQQCRLYSREMTRAFVRSTPANDLPNLTVDRLQYRLIQFWSLCLNRDEPPSIKDLPSDEKWVADLWSEIQRNLPQASAASAPDPTASIVSQTKVPPKPVAAKGVVVQSGQVQQPLCTHAHMRTVYNGYSWRCLK
jgi:hypothetical protein